MATLEIIDLMFTVRNLDGISLLQAKKLNAVFGVQITVTNGELTECTCVVERLNRGLVQIGMNYERKNGGLVRIDRGMLETYEKPVYRVSCLDSIGRYTDFYYPTLKEARKQAKKCIISLYKGELNLCKI